MRSIEALVLLTSAVSVLGAESTRPRGVGPEFAKFYKSKVSFTCISAPSVVVPISAVNDDYCDCPDGSDEPGTAACTYLSPLSPEQPVSGTVTGTNNVTLALPGYYCKNKGHVPAYIPFTVVNDGVCDWEICCDGSDEWEGVGGIKCENKCAAIGKEHKKKEAEKEKARLEASKRHAELVKEAVEMKKGLRQQIDIVIREVGTLQVQADDAKRKYDDVERKERLRVVSGGSEKANKVTVLARLAKRRVEELREVLVETIQRRDAAREKVKELEAILTTFKEEYNPNFNDEGVKRAVKAWEDYAASKDSEEPEVAAEERDVEEVSKPDTDSEGINWAEWETEDEESDVDVLYQFEQYLPAPLRTWLDDKLRSFRLMLIDNGILADPNNSTPQESHALTSARAAHESLNDALSTKQSSLDGLNSDLDADYGPSDVFRALKSKCLTLDSGEYTYELCWMTRTTQKSKKGGAQTNMGDFTRFERVQVDEELSDDGRGVGRGERISLRYENGQHCWNGPNRATTVVVACAAKDEVWRVREMEKCIYEMEVGSPAACDGSSARPEGPGAKVRDEL